jgi:tetratricopeptide (TPR) repeat protein
VRVCHSAFPTGDQQRITCLNLKKIHQFSWVLLCAVFVASLALFSPRVFGQTSPDAVNERSPWNPRDSSTDASRGEIPYVISVSHLKVPAKAAGHLEEAQKRFAKMQLAQATMEIDRAIEIYPAFAQAFCMRALVSLAEKDFTGSVESAAYAIRLDGADAYSWVALATAYNSLNEWPEAEAAAGRALSLDPSVWQGQLELAKSFYGERKFMLALSTLDQLKRDLPDIHLVRADSLMRLGRPQEAAQQFSIFLQETPGDSRVEQVRQILLRVQPVNRQSVE